MNLTQAQIAVLWPALVNETLVHKLHQHGFLAQSTFGNTAPEIEKAIHLGLDQFSTDTVPLAVEIRASLL